MSSPSLARGPGRRLTAAACAAALVPGLALAAPSSADDSWERAPLNDCHVNDNGDPAISSLKFSTKTIDVRKKSKTLVATAKLSDTGGPGKASGISSAQLTLYSTDGGYLWGSFRKKSGSWVARIPIPKGQKPGDYQASVYVGDRASNDLYRPYEDLVGFDRSLTVRSVHDTSRPALKRLNFASTKVNTKKKAKKVRISAVVGDKGSGVSNVTVQLMHKDRSLYAFLTRKKGMYVGTLQVPKWMGVGTYKATATVYDHVGNYRQYSYKALGPVKGDRKMRIVSRKDSSRPVIGKPSHVKSVDVRTKSKRVTVTVRLKDKGSGVHYAYAYLDGGGYSGAALKRVKGTPRNGVWKGSMRIDECASTPGRFDLQVSAADAAGNHRAREATKLRVRASDRGTPWAEVEDPSAAGPVVLSFDEDVNGLTTTTAVIRQNTFDGTTPPPVAGTWACETASGGPTSCQTGAVRTAKFTPATPFEMYGYYEVTLNPEHQLGLTDLAGNPFRRFITSFGVYE